MLRRFALWLERRTRSKPLPCPDTCWLRDAGYVHTHDTDGTDYYSAPLANSTFDITPETHGYTVTLSEQ